VILLKVVSAIASKQGVDFGHPSDDIPGICLIISRFHFSSMHLCSKAQVRQKGRGMSRRDFATYLFGLRKEASECFLLYEIH
jgi:hypothetical protein